MLLCIILGVMDLVFFLKALSTTLEYSWKELETRNSGVYHSYIAKFSLVLFQLCCFSNSGTVLRQGPGSYSKKICITKSLSSTELGPPPRWRMITSDWTQDSWSTALLPHHQPIKKKKKNHKSCTPHPKCCLLFLGTSDDHPIRSPVWPLSISSLRGANSFKLNCCYYKGECWFQTKNTLT